MRRSTWIIVTALTIILLGLSSHDGVAQSRVGLGSASKGAEQFGRIAAVLQSRRCIGCHPRGDRPTQGDDNHYHLMNVQRGTDGNGLPGMRCSTCHQQHNNEVAGIPGAPGWQMAPRSMGWSGLGQGELCRTLLDRHKNGGRSAADLVTHMLEAEQNYAWIPGGERNPPTLSIDELEQWVAAGAPCPK